MEKPVAEELSADVAAPSGVVFERLPVPRGAPDDLKKVTGIGPQLEQKLNEAGIYHYSQIAAMAADDVAALDTELKLNGRIDRDGWIATARNLLEAV